jgi:hypothetical protein
VLSKLTAVFGSTILLAIMPIAVTAASDYEVESFVREADGFATSYAFVQNRAPVRVAVCTFHGTQSWHKNEKNYLVTHGTVGYNNDGEATFGDVAVFGFRANDVSHPIVAVLQHIRGRDTEVDVDLRWEAQDRIGDLSSVKRFVCGVLRVQPRAGEPTWSDRKIASLYHAVSWGGAWSELTIPVTPTK